MLIVRSPRMLLLVVVATALVSTGSAGPALAQAEQECWRWITVVVGEDENGDPEFGPDMVNVCENAGGGGGSGGGEHTCQRSNGDTVPCVDPARGWWSHMEDCYVQLLSPPPPVGDPQWEGHHPEEGAVYLFSCPVGDTPGGWSESVDFREQAPEQPSVVELVQQAIERLPLPGPQIGIAPDPSGAGLVGLPVWMWTEDEATTWEPVTQQASIPGVVTVTAQAQATEIAWNMGDGSTVVCENPGTPYQARFGSEPSPTCGHVYAVASSGQPDGRLRVTATTNWQVQWWVEPRGSAAQSEEPLGFLRDSSTSVRINELQVVTS